MEILIHRSKDRGFGFGWGVFFRSSLTGGTRKFVNPPFPSLRAPLFFFGCFHFHPLPSQTPNFSRLDSKKWHHRRFLSPRGKTSGFARSFLRFCCLQPPGFKILVWSPPVRIDDSIPKELFFRSSTTCSARITGDLRL